MTTQEILNKLGIEQLNAMQQETMLHYRKQQSLVLLSPTGSGKTLAYLLPLIETLDTRSDSVQAIVLTPSRELALQTSDVVRQAGNPVRCVSVYGGRPAMDEHRTLRGVLPQLVVGTPGRVLDHLNKENIDAQGITTLVIDEFDKCLEMGFQEEMANVLSLLPNVQKRVLLSATDCPEIPRFVGTGTPARLCFLDDDAPVAERIEQWLVKSPVKDKLETLGRLLITRGQERSLVFVGFRESVQRVADYLRQMKFEVSAFHGGLDQKERERALFRFAGGSANVMVSTDLAARGLDIPEVDNVIHYHLPIDEQSLTHRNGRTARWDRTGRAFFIVGPEETLPLELEEYRIPATHTTPISIKPQWDTLYIGKGKKDKLSKGDIAGFLMKIGGLEKEDVRRIDVRDHYSYVAVTRVKVPETLVRVRGQKIKGLKTIIERTR